MDFQQLCSRGIGSIGETAVYTPGKITIEGNTVHFETFKYYDHRLGLEDSVGKYAVVPGDSFEVSCDTENGLEKVILVYCVGDIGTTQMTVHLEEFYAANDTEEFFSKNPGKIGDIFLVINIPGTVYGTTSISVREVIANED